MSLTGVLDVFCRSSWTLVHTMSCLWRKPSHFFMVWCPSGCLVGIGVGKRLTEILSDRISWDPSSLISLFLATSASLPTPHSQGLLSHWPVYLLWIHSAHQSSHPTLTQNKPRLIPCASSQAPKKEWRAQLDQRTWLPQARVEGCLLGSSFTGNTRPEGLSFPAREVISPRESGMDSWGWVIFKCAK